MDVTQQAEGALRTEVLAELAEFSGWLGRHGVRGYVGEVGWPASRTHSDWEQWNALGDAWYRAADDAGLWVTYFNAGAWEYPGYAPAAYWRAPWGGGGGPIDRIGTQAAVLRAHASSGGVLRGVHALSGSPNSTDSSPDTSMFSNKTPGKYGSSASGGVYQYDPQGSFDLLAREGHKLVRIDFRWERLQPNLNQPFDAAELGRLTAVVNRARKAGLKVILDVHNYGEYYLWDGSKGVRQTLGSHELPVATFQDLWKRLAAKFKDNPGVVAYGLMNEPHHLEPQFSASAKLEGWDTNGAVDGWNGQESSWVSSPRWAGAGALRVKHPGGTAFWLSDGDKHNWRARNLSGAGSMLSYRAYVPSDAPPASRYAAIFVTTADGSNHAGVFEDLKPGRWVQVSGLFPDDVLRQAVALNLYIGASTPDPFDVVVDDLAQGSGRTPVKVWEHASQQATRTIRSVDTRKTIIVGGYNYSRVQGWSDQHPRPWITDARVRYEGHHYWDGGSSLYRRSYAQLEADAAAR
ncbi:MAG: glycoside hydrolase family 5 protein [Chloroflexota bacterium]|nr:glycoside hydrolase family 5 protein [Chloroflexota bacterium]